MRTGGRVDLLLEATEPVRVRYRLELATTAGSWSGHGLVELATGRVEVEAAGAPAWLLDAARAFLRTAWSARRAPDAPAWPRRIQRWRATPASP